MTRRDPAIVVIGATGYTGSLVAEALTDADIPVVLAGRDPGRLAAVAAGAGGPETRVVDVTDPASLARLIRRGDAVINTAGPFTELGEPVIRACVEVGAHYLDTTGEQPFMRTVRERYHDAARSAGSAVVNAMAFEYALGDCAAALAARDLPRPLRSLDVTYAWGGTASSVGTRRTILRMLGRRAWVRREGQLLRMAPGRRYRRVTLASGTTLHAVAFGAGEILTVPRYLDVENARGWLVMGSPAARLVPLVAPALPVLVPLIRPLLEPLVTRAPDPTPQERAASRFTIRVELRADDRERAVEVQGADPYGTTALAAVHGARRAMEPDAPAGVLAPAQLVDPGAFLDALGERDLRLVWDDGQS